MRDPVWPTWAVAVVLVVVAVTGPWNKAASDLAPPQRIAHGHLDSVAVVQDVRESRGAADQTGEDGQALDLD